MSSIAATPTSGESEQTLNQLLVELDGIGSKQGIYYSFEIFV